MLKRSSAAENVAASAAALALALTAALLMLGLPRSAAAADPGITSPNRSFAIGDMRFDRYGRGEPALILIPGLSMGSWTWQAAISAFSSDHAVYAATLAGFDGMPPSTPPYIDQADTAVMQLITQERLTKPVVIGHSVGGHLALRLVEEHSDLLGGVILVDATPYFPPLQAGQTAEQRAQGIAQLAEGIASAPDWLYEDQTRATVSGMVTDAKQVDNVVQHSLRSDRATLARVTSEMSNEDLRPGLVKIAAPVLVVAPVSAQAPYMNDALRALTPDQLTDTVRNYYAQQYLGARTVTVQTIANSKHFIMLDQPDALNAAIKAFLAGLQPKP
jgi:pimeloyl-ACP methyl ester carboxylesterase